MIRTAFLAGTMLALTALPAHADCGKGSPLMTATSACIGQMVGIFFVNGHAQIEGTVVDVSDQSITIENPSTGNTTNRLIIPNNVILYLIWQHPS